MAIKIIFLDLDGTLLTTEKTLSPATRAALDRAAAAGIHIVPCTGRLYRGIPQEIRELPCVRYAAVVNGAQIYDAAEEKILCRTEIPQEKAERLYDYFETLPAIYDCYMDGWGYMRADHYARIDEYILDPKIAALARRTRKPLEDFRGHMRREGGPLQKVQVFFNDPERRRLELKRLTEGFPEMSVTSSLPFNIEINIREASKGEALRFLCRHLGIAERDSMAFGDGSNDASMLLAAGIGVAMGNSDEEALAAADYITDTNDSDGVAKAIERFCF